MMRSWMAGMVLASACTFSDGEPFATVTPTLRAEYVPVPARQVGDLESLLSGYLVRITRVEAAMGPIELIDEGVDAPSQDGHDHDHGAVEEHHESAESEAAPALVIGVGGNPAANLLLPADLTLECDPAACALDLVNVTHAHGAVASLLIEGFVSGGSLQDVPFRFLAPAPIAIGGELQLVADNQHAPHVLLRTRWTIGADVLDDVDFAPLATADPIVIDGVSSVAQRIAATPLTFEIERTSEGP